MRDQRSCLTPAALHRRAGQDHPAHRLIAMIDLLSKQYEGQKVLSSASAHGCRIPSLSSRRTWAGMSLTLRVAGITRVRFRKSIASGWVTPIPAAACGLAVHRARLASRRAHVLQGPKSDFRFSVSISSNISPLRRGSHQARHQSLSLMRRCPLLSEEKQQPFMEVTGLEPTTSWVRSIGRSEVSSTRR